MTEYTEKVERAGYRLQLMTIKNRWRKVIMAGAKEKARLKIAVDAKVLGIELEEIFQTKDADYWEGIVDSIEMLDELESDHFGHAMQWLEDVSDCLNPKLFPIAQQVARYAIEYHDNAPMIPLEEFGKHFGIKKSGAGKLLDRLVEEKCLVKIVNHKRQPNGLKSSNNFRLISPQSKEAVVQETIQPSVIIDTKPEEVRAVPNKEAEYNW